MGSGFGLGFGRAPLNGRGTRRSTAVPSLGSSPLGSLLAKKGQCESTAAAKTCLIRAWGGVRVQGEGRRARVRLGSGLRLGLGLGLRPG